MNTYEVHFMYKNGKKDCVKIKAENGKSALIIFEDAVKKYKRTVFNVDCRLVKFIN